MITTHREYQQAEVDWYVRNGHHPLTRISRDNVGQRYVIGDASWNRPGRPAEWIDLQMAAALARAAATQGSQP